MIDMNRRMFLGGIGALAASAGLSGCKCPFGCDRAKVAAQLYSIHKIFWKEPERCLAGLREAGFDGVEFAGFGDRSAKQIAKLLGDAGMRGMGGHVNGFTELKGDGLRKSLDFAAEAGLDSLVTPHAECASETEYRAFGRDMGLAAETAASYGIKIGIHTTYHHFTTKYHGVSAWDVIFSEASPLLQQQIDTSNTFHTGTDVVALLKKYAGRHHSVHLKENTPSTTATLGERPKDGGPLVPWKDVFAYLATEKVSWYVIEAEAIPDSLGPLAASAKFLEANRLD